MLSAFSCADIDLPQDIVTYARIAFFCEPLPFGGVQYTRYSAVRISRAGSLAIE
jgi:hypothetical protein